MSPAIHAVSRPNVDTQFDNAFADRLAVPEIASLNRTRMRAAPTLSRMDVSHSVNGSRPSARWYRSSSITSSFVS
jgi:hypothetical protein